MQISEAESVVMEVLWARSPQSAEEVVDALAGRQEWQEATPTPSLAIEPASDV